MRDDHVKIHMKLHANIDVMENVTKRADLERHKEAYEHCEQQRKKTRTISLVPPSFYETSIQNSSIEHDDDLHTTLQNEKRVYPEKTKLG